MGSRMEAPGHQRMSHSGYTAYLHLYKLSQKMGPPKSHGEHHFNSWFILQQAHALLGYPGIPHVHPARGKEVKLHTK